MSDLQTLAKEQCDELIAHYTVLARLADTPEQRELRALLPPEPPRFITVGGVVYERVKGA
jgi:hypothetical protein